MSQRSLRTQKKKLQEIEDADPYYKHLDGLQFTVLPKVYPGGTDTELLYNNVDLKKGDKVWDIGTGTGLVALKMKSKGARYVLATDLNPHAVRNAKLNSQNLKIKIDVKKADVFDGIKKQFNVITFNPPFTDHPAKKNYQTMFWDKKNKAVKNFFAGLRYHLKEDGRAFICWSSFGDRTLLKQLAKRNKLVITHIGRKSGNNRLYYDVFKLIPLK